MINTATNVVVATTDFVGVTPEGVAVNPAGTLVYTANYGSNSVSVIDTAKNLRTATIVVGTRPEVVAVSPAGPRVYVTNNDSNSVSVIDTDTNVVTATIAVGLRPRGLAVNPAGTRAYVANELDNSVSVIDTGFRTPIPSGPEVPRAAMQQFAVPVGTEAATCASLAPESVDWQALVSIRNVGWTVSYAQWPNQGTGGWVCTRQPYWTGNGWSVN